MLDITATLEVVQEVAADAETAVTNYLQAALRFEEIQPLLRERAPRPGAPDFYTQLQDTLRQATLQRLAALFREAGGRADVLDALQKGLLQTGRYGAQAWMKSLIGHLPADMDQALAYMAKRASD